MKDGARIIRLAHGLASLRPTLHNGPGWRINLWTQGCSVRCTNECLNPEMLSALGGHAVDTDRLVEEVLRVVDRDARYVEGITVLGGEPTDQAAPVARVFEALRPRGLSTMLYSGYRLGELRAHSDGSVPRLLELTDLLVDGPFIPALISRTLAWRGSRNQRLRCLSSRYTPADLERAFSAQGKGFSIRVEPDGRLSISGLQDRPAAAAIALRVRCGARAARPR